MTIPNNPDGQNDLIPLETEERKQILQQQISNFVRHGWYIVFQTDITVQLKKDKKFSFLIAAFGLLSLKWLNLFKNEKVRHSYVIP